MRLQGKIALVTGGGRSIGRAIAVQADASQAKQAQAMVAAAAEALDRIDVLVNNAGLVDADPALSS